VERRRWEDLDPGAVLADARARLLSSFGAEPLPSGRWPVILSPRVGVDFVGLTGEAVLGDAVFLGRSILHGRLGRRVGSPLVSLWDDGRRPGGVASRRWDAEGAPTRRTGVVRNGVLRAFLYDGLSARRAGARSTGNAVRTGRSAPPAPGITNFFLAPGRLSRRALYAGTPRAFVVWDVIGMHTADAASGDFSVGASGALWEKGRIRRAVRGVTLAGNLLDLWAGVDAVADDLTWPGAVGAPTFRVKELSLGGS
jgi:PmbA protein